MNPPCIASPSGVAGEAEAVRRYFSLYLLSDKQDNRCMARKKNPNAQALGSLGGKARAENLSDAEVANIASKGGKARAAKLSAAERSRIARRAVAARERKRKGGN
jgi:hypothetical protein